MTIHTTSTQNENQLKRKIFNYFVENEKFIFKRTINYLPYLMYMVLRVRKPIANGFS